MNTSKTSIVIAGLAVMAWSVLSLPTAQAAIGVNNGGVPVSITQSGTNYVYTYSLVLFDGTTLSSTSDPMTTSEVVFYDFAGYVPGTAQYNNNGTFPASYTVSTSLFGPIVTGAQPVPADNPLVPNVIFNYTGAPIVANGSNIQLGTFSLTSMNGPFQLTRGRLFVYQDSQNGGGTESGNVNITLPVVPEPSSVAAFAFTGLGLAGLMLRARRSRRTTA